jgi:nucleoside-diphosphate-sugar epimerase
MQVQVLHHVGNAISHAAVISVTFLSLEKRVPSSLIQKATIRAYLDMRRSWSVIDADDYNKILQQVKDDSILPEDVVVKSGASEPESTTSLLKARCILLTGATGFLGVHALTEILSRYPTCDVVCLVRSGDKQDVQTNMERYGLSGDLSRVVVVKGDLSSPLLGLSQGEWDTMASTIDAIVHCAAAVSLTAPYSMLQPINVSGTLSVIRLACACKSGTPLVHVSSNGIFAIDKDPDEIFLENDDIKCLPGRLGASNGYGLSKWAAERLVTAAHARGLPTMTIRFGNIGWHSITGLGNSLDYQGMLLSGCRRLSSRPQTEGHKGRPFLPFLGAEKRPIGRFLGRPGYGRNYTLKTRVQLVE